MLDSWQIRAAYESPAHELLMVEGCDFELEGHKIGAPSNPLLT